MPQSTYADVMEEGTPHLEVVLDLEQPVELLELVAFFAAIGGQFDRYIKERHPSLDGHARLYVTEISKGSIRAVIVPMIKSLISTMDGALIVDGFVNRLNEILKKFISGRKKEDASRGELKDFLGSVLAVAHDTDGKAIISSAEYHETKTTKRVTLEFNTQEAQQARDQIEKQRIEIELPSYEPRERVLMRFYQSNLGDPAVGRKNTGERVIIEDITQKPLQIIYETERAKERIKYETSEDEKNLYRKGFIVDVYVQRSQGKPVAYRITDVHEVFDIPDED